MTKVLTVFNHNGGVGKTTLIYTLAWELVKKGKNVLLADMDSQMHLTKLVLKTAATYVDDAEEHTLLRFDQGVRQKIERLKHPLPAVSTTTVETRIVECFSECAGWRYTRVFTLQPSQSLVILNHSSRCSKICK